MNMITFIMCILLTIFVVLGIIYAIYTERKDFNNGYCPKCGKKLKLFDMDSQGGRGYCCHDCMYFTWISYNCVDKNYNKLK